MFHIRSFPFSFQTSSENRKLTSSVRCLLMLDEYCVGREGQLHEWFVKISPFSNDWESIVPQLFSLLDHHKPFVRDTISAFLLKMSSDVIIYPTVVGSHTERFNRSESFRAAHERILARLKDAGYSVQILAVEKMIMELRRITLLWEEQWFHRLSGLQSDVERRIERFKAEYEKFRSKRLLHDLDYDAYLENDLIAVITPIRQSIQNLMDHTMLQPPSTPHEVWFVSTFGQKITDAVKDMEHPPPGFSLEKAWAPLKAVSFLSFTLSQPTF